MVADHASRSKLSIYVNVTHGEGMHWNSTKQCSTCCGTLAYPMQVLVSSGAWKYVNPKDVTFRESGFEVSGRWAPGWGPFIPLTLRYAWEDFPQCVFYNSAGLPAAPFNVTVPPAPAVLLERVQAQAVALARGGSNYHYRYEL
jgi:hypothetical protein